MLPQPRTGSFSPNQTTQPIYTGLSQSPHPSYAGAPSAGASPSTSSPTGNTLTKIAVAQVYLLLSTIKQDRDDPHKWDVQTESLRKVSHLDMPHSRHLRDCHGRGRVPALAL
jgi:CCR4-NOT transcription complex subunit 1